MKMKLYQLANILTLSRLFVLPAFLFSLINSSASHTYRTIAYLLFIYFFLSDLVDGYLVRKGGEKNYIGQFIDPLADKVFLGMSYIVLTTHWGRPPSIIVFIIAGRYIFLGLLWFTAFVVSEKSFFEFLRMENVFTTPTLLGKATTWGEVILLGIVVFNLPAFIRISFYLLVPAFSIITGGSYLYLVLTRIKNYQAAETAGEREALRRMNDFLRRWGMFKQKTDASPLKNKAGEKTSRLR
jgi:phosphatidylglycerophosphate synthase